MRSRASPGAFVVRLIGSYTNVVGLPLAEVAALLAGEGYPVLRRLAAGMSESPTPPPAKPCPICGKPRDPELRPVLLAPLRRHRPRPLAEGRLT